MPKISILIVNYNTREMTLACLRSVFVETKTSFELIVVDNASSDGSAGAIARDFPQVRLIAETENHGFAGGNNLAAKEATGDYVLLLNPDTIVLDGAIDKLVAFAETHPAAGIWGGRTLFGDLSLNRASCWGRMTLWSVFCTVSGLARVFSDIAFFNPEEFGGWARDSVRQVDIVSGCFLMTRRALWERLGGFASEFFMYGEEADLCLRAGDMGCRPMVTPEATIIHYGGASERLRSEKMIWLIKAKMSLIRRHWSPVGAWMGMRLYALWPLTRVVGYGLLKFLRGRSVESEQYEVWASVWRERSRWFGGY